MKLKFERFEPCIELNPKWVSTLEVEDGGLFSGMVEALVSERGESSAEPYVIFSDEGRSIAARGKLLVLNSLPCLPLTDQSMKKSLYLKMAAEISEHPENEGMAEDLADLAAKMCQAFAGASLNLWGDYQFEIDWDIVAFLKAFGYSPRAYEGEGLLEKCINFLSLCVDIGYSKPLVFVNLKKFLSERDAKSFVEQSIFHGISVLLLESGCSEFDIPGERKTSIDHRFLVSY